MEIDVEVRDLGEGKGRALFALRDFAKGDIIIREFPLAAAQFSWNKTCKYRACDHCLKSIETATEMARLGLLVNDLQFILGQTCLSFFQLSVFAALVSLARSSSPQPAVRNSRPGAASFRVSRSQCHLQLSQLWCKLR